MKRVLSIVCALNLFVAVSAFAVEEVKTAPAAAPQVEAAPAPATAPVVVAEAKSICLEEKALIACNKVKNPKMKIHLEKKYACNCPAVVKKAKLEVEKKIHAVKKHAKATIAPKVEKTEAAPVAEEKTGE